MDTAPLNDKFTSFGFDTQEVDGHSVEKLHLALSNPSATLPSAIIAETIKGKGVSFMENKAKWHHGDLNELRYNKALMELEGKGNG
jgi:transketolase